MCRFVAYIGNPIIVDDVLYKAKNSLVHQSFGAREMAEPLNGDGFGLGWYAHDIDNLPGRFRSTHPAWSDPNLKSIAPKIRTDCFFAHIRAASSGAVDLSNCHPFSYHSLSFMHNGGIENFGQIRRKLRAGLSDEVYNSIEGQTDSEHFFALILEFLTANNLTFNVDNAAKAIQHALQATKKLLIDHGIDPCIYLNIVLSNGRSMVATRYSSHPEKFISTLYYAAGSQYQYYDGECHMTPSETGQFQAILLASEKLNNHKADWHLLPENHLLAIDQNLSLTTTKIED